MKRIAFILAVLMTATAHAQIYQWKDENGKTVLSDKPPIGTVVKQRKLEAPSPTEKTVPQKSMADRELEFRKRQKDAQESAEKTAKEKKAKEEREENCSKARRYAQALESGERISSRDEKGERTIMDDTQREREIAKTRQFVLESCP